MSYRYMRMIVFFDLPTETAKDRREYRKFRKMLINEGFLMMQESVYSKLALNMSVVNSQKNKLEASKPKKGIVQILVITEKQFASIDTVVGSVKAKGLDSTERLVVI